MAVVLISCTNRSASSTAASSGRNTFTATLHLCLRSSTRWGRSAEQALEVVEGWLALRSVVTLDPASEHWTILRDLLGAAGTAGNLTRDAHLAAIAIGHGCELCSTDSDFGRFRHLRWRNPIL